MPITQFPASVSLSNLNGKNGFTIIGAVAGGGSGWSVSSAGDINYDGIVDLIIGAPVVSSLQGASYVIFGKQGIGVSGTLNLGSLNGTNGFVMPGVDVSGWSVSGAGDINGDGIDDLVIGAPNNGGGAGKCFVVFGGSSIGSSGILSLTSLNGANGFSIFGITANDYTCESVANVGDLNNDGITDLVIGAPVISSSTGACYVLFGKSGIGSSGSINLSALDGSNGFAIQGVNVGDALGSSVSGAGDINKDGIVDLIIGAPGPGNYGNTPGKSYVLFGHSGIGSSGTFDLTTLNGANGFVILGIAGSSGASVSGVGDINDDGISDLLIGAPIPSSYSHTGVSYVVFGQVGIGSSGTLSLSNLIGSNGFVILGSVVGELFGNSASKAGDINGDGITDLIIGANQGGAAYVIFGSTGIGNSGSLDSSTLDGINGFAITGASIGDTGASIGYTVNSAGDLNADGVMDLVIGSSSSLGGAGRSYVIFGDTPVSLFTNQLTIGKGHTQLISSSCLNATSIKFPNRNALIIFSATSIQYGYFQQISNPSVAVTSFTQQQIKNSQIQFVHDDSVFAPSYSISVSDDGFRALIPPQPATITFIHLGPQLVKNTLAINQGQTLLLTLSQLGAIDLDSQADNTNLIFMESNVQHGQFELVINPGVPITSFTQAQVQTSQIQFVHDGSVNSPSYSVQVSDGIGGITTSAQAATIAFNLPPVLGNNILGISQGQTLVLTSANFSATDPDDAAPGLTFLISNLQYGRFEQVSNPGTPITSFTQAQIQSGAIQFVASSSTNPPSFSVAVSDGKAITAAQVSTIAFNLAPVLGNNQLTINQGQTIILTAANLSVTDPDDSASNLSFLVSNVQHGQFELVSSPGVAITSFTQAQVQSSAIQFVQDASVHTPGYSVSVSDGKIATAPQSSVITFNLIPTLTVNSLSINQGQTLILTSANLSANDPDVSAASLVFTVTNIQNGHFELVSAPGNAITSFTQGQLLGGSVKFIHDGSMNAPSFNVSVSTGAVSTAPQACAIFFDIAPVIGVNNLNISQGQTMVLTASNLSATQIGGIASSLIFTVSNVAHGHFELVSSPGIGVASFTQAQVQAGDVQFVHDGSVNAPSYSISVSDGKITTSPQSSIITFNAAPILVTNALNVSQGKTVKLTTSNLGATDVDSAADSLLFMISNVQHGHFELVSDPGVAITQFTQAQIQSGGIQFIQDGSANSPSYNVAVSDGKVTTTTQASTITFNATPVLTGNQLTIVQSQTVTVTPSDLSATDDHTAASDLIFTAQGVQHGHFEDSASPGNPIFQFAQQKIFNGALRFVTDGSIHAPAYNISVSDGLLTTLPLPAIINFALAPQAASSVSDNTVRNAIIGATVSGGIGLLFFALKLYLTHRTDQSRKLQPGVNTSEREKNVLRIALEVFKRVKTSNFLGYRSDSDTQAYIDAIRKIVDKLEDQKILNFDSEKRSEIAEVAKHIRKVIGKLSCCTCAHFSSFFRREISPQDLAAKADEIATAVATALQLRSLLQLESPGSPLSSTRETDIEMQETKQRQTSADEQRLRKIEAAMQKLLVHNGFESEASEFYLR